MENKICLICQKSISKKYGLCDNCCKEFNAGLWEIIIQEGESKFDEAN